MSRAFGLVRFQDNSIYWFCYNGTTDIALPQLISSEELLEYGNGKYSIISWSDEICYKKSWQPTENCDDIQDVEIYSDYGGGFWWNGKASKNERLITFGVNPYEEVDVYDYKPQWVVDFENNM